MSGCCRTARWRHRTKLTAYIGGARDVREVDGWLAGDGINADQESRFRLTLRVVEILLDKEPQEVVQAWPIGLNPELGDQVPMRLLCDEGLDTIAADLLAAARVMAEHGWGRRQTEPTESRGKGRAD